MSVLFEQYLALRKGKVVESPTPNQATQGIPFETLETLYQEVKDRLDAVGVDWDNVDFNTPAYNQVKDKVNEVWLVCLEGKATLGDFKEALACYEQVILASARPPIETQERLF